MADIDAVLAGLTAEELNEMESIGPKGHLGRHLLDALDRAAGGPGAARGFCVLDGTVNGNGGQFWFSVTTSVTESSRGGLLNTKPLPAWSHQRSRGIQA
jgi:hypothetical protein